MSHENFPPPNTPSAAKYYNSGEAIGKAIGTKTPFKTADWFVVPRNTLNGDKIPYDDDKAPRQLVRIIVDDASGKSAMLRLRQESDLWSPTNSVVIDAFDADQLRKWQASLADNSITGIPTIVDCHAVYVTDEGMLTMQRPANFSPFPHDLASSRADPLEAAMRMAQDIVTLPNEYHKPPICKAAWLACFTSDI